MTPQQEAHLKETIAVVSMLINNKYRKGAAEHGNNLMDMPIGEELDELTNELIDGLVFIIDIASKLQAFKKKYDPTGQLNAKGVGEGAEIPTMDRGKSLGMVQKGDSTFPPSGPIGRDTLSETPLRSVRDIPANEKLY